MDHAFRSRRWTTDSRPRYWWHRLPGMDFVPPIYSDLSGEEWTIMSEWFDATDRNGMIGECVVPLISFIHGLVLGNRIDRVVQLGTHAGYAALLIGFMLRRMNAKNALFSLDLDSVMCETTRAWLERAGLSEYVSVAQLDSRNLEAPRLASDYLRGAPQMILLDSSHEYAATLRELDLWYPALHPGGLILLHDVSRFAIDFDVTKEGGVRRAFAEWRAAHPEAESFLFNGESRSMDLPRAPYKDACGLALVHKPGVPATA